MTKKLFYNTPYETTFTGTVLSCEKNKDRYEIILDQTLFYPEGGGQSGDIGTLNEVEIFDTHEKDDIVIHYSKEILEVGAKVTGNINWEYRFDLMQNHTGEHMLSGVICKKYGYNNVGFHMGKERISLDFDGKVPSEDLPILEAEVNNGIWRNFPIDIKSYKDEELNSVNYRSKIPLTGEVRIVTSDVYDCCACCGTHVAYSGEVGLMKIVSIQNYKGGSRLEILCGNRAVKHYNMCHQIINKIGTTFSVPEEKTFESIEKLVKENTQIQEKLKDMQLDYFTNKKEKILNNLKSKDNNISDNILILEKDLNSKDISMFSQIILEGISEGISKDFSKNINGVLAVFSENDFENYSFLISSKEIDVKGLFNDLKERFSCKGGGRFNSVQGSLSCSEKELISFFEENSYILIK